MVEHSAQSSDDNSCDHAPRREIPVVPPGLRASRRNSPILVGDGKGAPESWHCPNWTNLGLVERYL